MSPSPSQDAVIARGTPPVTRHPDIACRDTDTEVFYPGPGQSPATAIAICGQCPHRQECLQWALDTEQSFGVWGGLTGDERREILQETR